MRTRASRECEGAEFLFCNLGDYSSDSLLVADLFDSPQFARWREKGGELHIFLDSFDECLSRVDSVAELLAGRFGRLVSVPNLFLRIASRTAEWRTSLEDALRQVWGTHAVGVFELAPLTRAQVLEAANVHISDAERFVGELVASQAVPFAIKPLTLDLLIRIWKSRGGSLPATQREIYEQGCLELCTEPENRQTPKLRRQFFMQRQGKSGALHGRLNRSIEGLVRMVKLGFLDLGPAVLVALFALVAALWKSPVVAIVMILFVPIGLKIILNQIRSQKGIRLDSPVVRPGSLRSARRGLHLCVESTLFIDSRFDHTVHRGCEDRPFWALFCPGAGTG